MAQLILPPAVNGHRYSFVSIDLTIADLTLPGITAVAYTDELPGVEIYGSDSIRIGRAVGKRKLSASFEVLRLEWVNLLLKLGNSYGRVKIAIQVQYADKDQPVVTDGIEGWIQKVESQNEEGTQPSTVKIDIDAMEILHGGQVTTPDGGIDGHGLDQSSTADNDPEFWALNTASIEGPKYAPNPWDTVTFGGGLRLPGLCKVKGLPTLAFDKKKAGGVDGASITVNGYLPGPIDVECMIWTPAQYTELRRMAPFLWTKPNKKTKTADFVKEGLAKDIIHPTTSLWGIKQVVILGVSVLEDGPLPGTKMIKIKCVEFVEPKAVSKTKTTKKEKANAPMAEPVKTTFGKNEAGESPNSTDTGPGGPKKIPGAGN